MVELWNRLKSSMFNRFFPKFTHIMLGPIRWNAQKNWTYPKNVTYVSMATKIPIIKHREFFHISMCYISAINEHISSKCTPVMHRNMVNSQKSNYLEISRSTSNTWKTMKIIVAAITFEPNVVETSGWLQINPWRNTYRRVISICICEAPFGVTWRYNITFFLTK